ncbi:MAG: Gfo/Idh/MocA family protein [Egibacteraceae bacterium]
MRVGVVGCGYWGAKHVRVLQSLAAVEQVALIDPLPAARATLGKAFPALLSFSDLEEALAHVNALVIATPPSTHATLGLRALRAGKHVLIEKPLATNAKDAQALVEAAETNGMTLMVGHTFVYNPAVWRLREIVASGELGDIHYIDTARLNLGMYQQDVNVVWDLAPHDVSIVDYILQSTPQRVHAWGGLHAHSFLEDVAYLRLEYTQVGVDVQVHVSWLDPCKVRRVTVVGSEKMAVYNDLATEEPIRIYNKGVAPAARGAALTDPPMSYRYGDIVSPFIQFEEPLRVEDQHFVECILEGRTPDTDGASGLAVVKVLEAATTALWEGRPVHVEQRELTFR